MDIAGIVHLSVGGREMGHSGPMLPLEDGGPLMPLYTFYPCTADGSSATFVSFDLQDDGEAQVRAVQVLEQHPECSQIVVWAGERRVFARDQVHPELRAVLGRR